MINTHIAPAWTGGLDETKITFSRLLKEKGYTLDYLGKWHVNQIFLLSILVLINTMMEMEAPTGFKK